MLICSTPALHPMKLAVNFLLLESGSSPSPSFSLSLSPLSSKSSFSLNLTQSMILRSFPQSSLLFIGLSLDTIIVSFNQMINSSL